MDKCGFQFAAIVLTAIILSFSLTTAVLAQDKPPAPPPVTTNGKVAASEIIVLGTITRVRYRFGTEPIVDTPGDRSGWTPLGDFAIDKILLNKGIHAPKRVYVIVPPEFQETPASSVGTQWVYFGELFEFNRQSNGDVMHLLGSGWSSLTPVPTSQLEQVKNSIRQVQSKAKAER